MSELNLKEDPKQLILSAIRVEQPIGEFYIGAIDANDLCEISWFDIRRIIKERDLDSFIGIQRQISPKRVEEIRRYVRTGDATFPTGVILAVDERCAVFEPLNADKDTRFGHLTLRNYMDEEDMRENILYRQIAKVIDGQHRIEGLREGYRQPFEINVVIFVGADIADQASVFATVNLAQTKVNRSLVYDLLSLTKNRSPEKSCHEIVVVLDKEEESPFFEKIKRLGVATPGRTGETLSQATVVRSLLKYISDDPVGDRELMKKGERLAQLKGQDETRLFLRNFFIEEKEVSIVNILWNYFDAVKEKWPVAWKKRGDGYILNRTNGFNGLMRFLRPAYLAIAQPGSVPTSKEFSTIFSNIDLRDDYFTTENFKPGTSGETAIYHQLLVHSGIEDPWAR